MSEVRWLSEEQHDAWRAYLAMHARLVGVLGRRLQASSGLSAADFEVLVPLSEAPDGRIRPYELQVCLEWAQSRLSHHLTRMQKRGLVRREECTEDGRGSVIVLTETGRRAFLAALPAHVDAVRELFFEALSPADVTTLRRLADQISARLDTGGGIPG